MNDIIDFCLIKKMDVYEFVERIVEVFVDF